MKNTVKIAGMLMILLLTGSNLSAQRGMRGFRNDTAFMNQRHDSLRMQMAERRRSMNFDSADWGMRHSYGRRPAMRNLPGGFGYGEGMPFISERNMRTTDFRNQHRRGMMAYGSGMGYMRQNMPGRMIMQSIPGVTQEQKDELAKLNKAQQEDMQKLREKQQEAVKTLREEHRKKIMNILTDDQKKWLEENAPQAEEK
jgi:hypothetical protein